MPAAGQIIRALDFPPEQQADNTGTAVQGISSTTYIPGDAQCAVTFVAGTSGKVRVHVYGRIGSDDVNRMFLSFELRQGDATGPVITPASDSNAVITKEAGLEEGQDAAVTVSGLTPGVTYFARTMHRILGGSSGSARRRISVEPTT